MFLLEHAQCNLTHSVQVLPVTPMHHIAAHALLAFAAINGQVGGAWCRDLQAGKCQKGRVLLSHLLDLLNKAKLLPRLTLFFLPLYPHLLLLNLCLPLFLLPFLPCLLLCKKPLVLLLPLGSLRHLLLLLNKEGLIIPNG